MEEPNPSTFQPVIINGAGPVGLSMACSLARHGTPFRIFDKAPEPATQSRALAIFPRTIEVFNTLGILDEVLDQGLKLDEVCMYNESRELAHMKFDSIDSPYKFAISLPQSHTERILQSRLEALGSRVERQMELVGLTQDATGVTASYRKADGSEETVAGSWFLGCDGAHSAARHLIGMNFQGAQYEEEFLLADVKIDSDLPTNQASLFTTADGLFAYFPFKGGRGRIIADHRIGATHAAEEPTMEEIATIAKHRCFQRFEISDPAWKAWFRISHRIVESFSSGRVFLCGDAAHIHSPAGGQGMNTGIQDAFNLAWKIDLVLRGLADIGFLASYEAERMPVVRSTVNITDRMTRTATAHGPAAKHLRDMLIPLMSGLPFVREAMAQRMAEISIDYRGTDWVENHGLGPVHAGDRAPDAVLYDRVGRREVRIFDLLKTPGFVLLAFEGYSAKNIDPAILKDLPGQVYRIRRPGLEIGPADLEDRDCVAGKAYGAAEDGLLILIRPDGYVAYRGPNAAELSAYLGRLKGLHRPD